MTSRIPGSRAGAFLALAVLAATALGQEPAADAPAKSDPPAPTRITIGGDKTPKKPKARPDAVSTADPVEAALAEARGLIRLGKQDEAIAKLRALAAKPPVDPRVILLLGRQLVEIERHDEAIGLYEGAIASSRDPGPLLIDLERVYREMGRMREALELCLEYQARYGAAGGWVQEEVESLVRSDRLGAEALEVIGRAVERSPNDEGLGRLWIQVLFHAGRSVESLAAAQALDERLRARGAVLMEHALMAREENDFDHALLGFDQVLAASPPGELKVHALHEKARALRKLRRLDESLLAYDALLAEGRTSRTGRAAGLEKARILADELNRDEEALQAYRELLIAMGSRPKGDDREIAGEVRLAMAECALELGRPEEAGTIYAALADSAADPETRARALFESAEMLFYQGKMKEAETAFYRLTDEFEGNAWVNDALERILVIGENADEGGAPLAALAQAAYQRRLGRADRALQLVSAAIAAHPRSRAQDDLRWMQLRLLLDGQQFEQAQLAADALAAGFAESPLASRGLVEVAQRLAQRVETRRMAQQLYERVLLTFPDCIEAAAVRAALRDLKSQLRESSDAGADFDRCVARA